MRKRVVITGLGALTPLGPDTETTWQAAQAGKSGIAPLERLDFSALDVRFGGEVRGFDPAQFLDRRDARRTDRFVQFAIAAAEQAIRDAGLSERDYDPDRFGAICGTGIGGIETLTEQHRIFLERGADRVSPFFIPMMIANMAAGQIAIRFGLRGPNMTFVTACSSSANALGDAFRAIQHDEADLMIAGGAEAVLLPLCYAGFINMKALSTRNDEPERASRPFDRDRDGFVMAEGAGMLVLEEREHALSRSARIYAEVVGYGTTADAYHMVEPSPEGEGAARAMELALRDGSVPREAVGYINAHATSTPKGDVGEALAIRRVFGKHADRLAVSSTKSMTGHLLGAAGGVEAIFTTLALKDGVLPPTINLEHLDPEIDLDCLPQTARKAEVEYALTNSFGFGGQNVSLALRRYDATS